MSPLLLIAIFIVSTLIGYKLIKNVPSLLHTPLMSGMNALSGITVLGALSATGRLFIPATVSWDVSPYFLPC